MVATVLALVIGAAVLVGALRYRRSVRRRESDLLGGLHVHSPDVRSRGARMCAHDAGVWVDEEAWAGIVEGLKRTSNG